MMNLRGLGFDNWFSAHADAILQPGHCVAKVTTVDRGAFLVHNGEGETSAELAGKFSFEIESVSDLPCVGDWVCIEQSSPYLAIIHAVLPRKTLLRRKSAGKTIDFQLIAANLDIAFIVQSCHYDFNVKRLDRYLVAVAEAGIDPVVLLSKTDLVTSDQLEELIDSIREYGISVPILPISTQTCDGLDAFTDLLEPCGTFCLIGSSGVGKTTLLNHLLGHQALETRSVSATGEGMHTTSRRQLLVLSNGAMLIDTPGMRELGLLGSQDAVEDSFTSIQDLANTCRFSNCTHIREPGCAVLAALESGDLSEERYQSYLKLRKESAFHDMSQVEQRQKDKDFGRMIKSVKKYQKRRRGGKR